MSALWPSFVRTFVPRLAAWIVALAASIGWGLDVTVATVVATEIFAGIYYLVARYLETFKDSKYGRLLYPVGRQPGAPAYWTR